MASVRPMRDDDLAAMLDLWVASWQAAYPSIDFAARRGWAETRFAELRRDGAHILVAEADSRLGGLVTVNPATGYIDQIVVAAGLQRQGIASHLIGAARAVSPSVLDLHVNQDNDAAVAFYRRQGFIVSGQDANPRSGAPTYRMTWRALQIRDAVAEDAAAACEVLRRSIIELCVADHHNDPKILDAWLANKTPAIVASWIARPDNSLMVADETDVIIAVGSVTDAGEIQLNYVSPEARLRGVSRALLRALEQRATERGNIRSHLVSTETARRFYIAAGYSEDAPPQGRFGTTSSYPMSKQLRAGA